jgi:hypothetical protein
LPAYESDYRVGVGSSDAVNIAIASNSLKGLRRGSDKSWQETDPPLCMVPFRSSPCKGVRWGSVEIAYGPHFRTPTPGVNHIASNVAVLAANLFNQKRIDASILFLGSIYL